MEPTQAMNANTVHEIENAISTLSAAELEELYSWLEQHRPQPIGARHATDLDAGRLDGAIFRALDDQENGRTQSL